MGGRDFDGRIAEHFVQEFKKKYKVDAKTNPRAYTRLLGESEKLKKLMSANSNSLPLNIECFMDDKDVHGKMARDEFEGLVGDLLKRANTTLESALSYSSKF